MCDRGSRELPNSAAQAIVEVTASWCGRTNTPTPPALFISGLKQKRASDERRKGADFILARV